MAYHLKDHLYLNYAGRGENSVSGRTRATHLTIYAGASHTLVRHRPRRDVVSGISSRPTSIHIYGIVDTAFVLELRNLPMSIAIEQFAREAGGEIDMGQNHGTVRFILRPSDAHIVRRLADLIRGVPLSGRVDRFAGPGSEAYPVHRALAMLATCLDGYELQIRLRAAVSSRTIQRSALDG